MTRGPGQTIIWIRAALWVARLGEISPIARLVIADAVKNRLWRL